MQYITIVTGHKIKSKVKRAKTKGAYIQSAVSQQVQAGTNSRLHKEKCSQACGSPPAHHSDLNKSKTFCLMRRKSAASD